MPSSESISAGPAPDHHGALAQIAAFHTLQEFRDDVLKEGDAEGEEAAAEGKLHVVSGLSREEAYALLHGMPVVHESSAVPVTLNESSSGGGVTTLLAVGLLSVVCVAAGVVVVLAVCTRRDGRKISPAELGSTAKGLLLCTRGLPGPRSGDALPRAQPKDASEQCTQHRVYQRRESDENEEDEERRTARDACGGDEEDCNHRYCLRSNGKGREGELVELPNDQRPTYVNGRRKKAGEERIHTHMQSFCSCLLFCLCWLTRARI